MRLLKWLALGFFLTISLVIVFVTAGEKTGVSGGDQAKAIFDGASKGVASVAVALEGRA